MKSAKTQHKMMASFPNKHPLHERDLVLSMNVNGYSLCRETNGAETNTFYTICLEIKTSSA